MLLYQISESAIHQKVQKSQTKKNQIKRSTSTCNEEFELPDGSYSVSDIQDYFEYIIKKHENM